MKNTFLLIALTLLAASPAFASWHYNENAGFGIYQPEGWSARIEGRSSRLHGPDTDGAQSDLFLGSDWVSGVADSAQLKAHLLRETGAASAEPISLSELEGWRVGTLEEGSIYLLRSPGNVIVVEFQLRGSAAQREEGQTMLGSIEVRKRGIEN